MVSSETVSLPEPLFERMSWRPPEKSDVPAIVALQGACCDVDRTERWDDSDVLDWWADSSNDQEADALLGFDTKGELVVSIWSRVPAGATSVQRIGGDQNQIHPRVRSDAMNQFVLDWWEARGRQRVFGDRFLLPAEYTFHRLVAQEDEIEFLTSRGYEVARHFHELIRDLADPISVAEAPSDITVRPLGDHRIEARRIHNDAFRDHWGSEPITAERWGSHLGDHFEPDSSFVAFDGDDAVAYVMCSTYPSDFVDRGWSHTWIEGIGTVRSHRRRGLASMLVARATKVIAEAGMEYALLEVDADNPTGAYGVYEDLGFREFRRGLTLTKSL